MNFNDVLINICLGLLALLLFGFLCVYAFLAYQAYKIRKAAVKILKKEGKEQLTKGIEAGISKFQQKLNEEIRKKTDK